MTALLRERNFALLWFGGLISMLGDWVLLIALPFHVYERTGSALATSAMFLASMLPSVLLGSVAGVFVDRWDRRRVMVVADVVQAVLVLPLLLVGSDGWLWLAYGVAFLQSSVARFSGPAENALLPRLVGEERLLTANSLNALNDNLARLIGAPLGGALMAFSGLGGVVLVDSLSFLVAGVMVWLIAAPRAAGEASEAAVEAAAGRWTAFWRDWSDGLKVIAGSRLLLVLLAVAVIGMLSNTIRSPLIIPFTRDVLQGGAVLFGLIASIQGTGGLVGGLLVGRWGAALDPARLIVWSGLAIGLSVLVLVNVPSVPLALALVALAGVPSVALGTSQQTLLQGGVPDRYRGRVFGAVGTTTALIALVGYVSAGTLGDVFGTVPMLNVTGGLDLLGALVALLLITAAPKQASGASASARFGSGPN